MSKSESFATNTKISQFLTRERKRLGLTQIDVARRLKKPQSFVSKVESGTRKLTAADLVDVCKALSIKPADFFRRVDKEGGS